jgi:hypothetical protein
MNNAIYLTLKKLDNPESVSKRELRKAIADAASAYASAYASADAASAYASADTASYAYFAVVDALRSRLESAKYWVNEYLEITGENKKDYLDVIKAEK